MITGVVEGRHAYVITTVFGAIEQEAEIEFILDTGFTAQLTLPRLLCEQLALTYLRLQPADLADGTTVMLEVHEAAIFGMMWSKA